MHRYEANRKKKLTEYDRHIIVLNYKTVRCPRHILELVGCVPGSRLDTQSVVYGVPQMTLL